MQINKIVIIFLFLLIYNSSLIAKNKIGSDSGNPIPRFVSIKSSEANLRVGPDTDYPIILKYIMQNIPLKVEDEFDKWRKIIDSKNNIGWVHVSLLSNKRYGIIEEKFDGYVNMLKKPNGSVVGSIGSGNIVKLKKCEDNWCLIMYEKYEGWIKNNHIWGLLNNENFD